MAHLFIYNYIQFCLYVCKCVEMPITVYNFFILEDAATIATTAEAVVTPQDFAQKRMYMSIDTGT